MVIMTDECIYPILIRIVDSVSCYVPNFISVKRKKAPRNPKFPEMRNGHVILSL